VKAHLCVKNTFTENSDVLVVDTASNLNHGTKMLLCMASALLGLHCSADGLSLSIVVKIPY
jgi:hypothetical protein